MDTTILESPLFLGLYDYELPPGNSAVSAEVGIYAPTPQGHLRSKTGCCGVQHVLFGQRVSQYARADMKAQNLRLIGFS